MRILVCEEDRFLIRPLSRTIHVQLLRRDAIRDLPANVEILILTDLLFRLAIF